MASPQIPEQVAVDAQYARLDELRSIARERLASVRAGGPTGSPQNRSERDSFATLYENRISQLDAVEDRLCFGRLDYDDGTGRYVGRIGLTDDAHQPILTDWRAPAATAFYQATAAHRLDVWRRRHISTQGRVVVHLDDDVLDLARVTAEPGSAAVTDREGDAGDLGAVFAGQGALMAALSRGRTAHMQDIVATIQAEQDTIIRSPMHGAVVVQGGPGTGKTAVALHRAAYLLYAHRKRLENAGVLIVGPSPDFLRYIDRVLPSLGETGVVSLTIATLLPNVRATAQENASSEELKGRLLWPKALARAVRARQRVPHSAIAFALDGTPMTIEPSDVMEAISRARRTRKPHNEARASFVSHMLTALTRQYTAAQHRLVNDDDIPGITEDLRSHPVVRRELNLAWFPITAQQLVADLWAKPHRLAHAAPELSDGQRALLQRPLGSPWTSADIPLIDEAMELLGNDDQSEQAAARERSAQRAEAVEYARQALEASGAGGGLVDAELLADRFEESQVRGTTAEQALADRAWTYGHVVVDEAQELSAMAWRALVRRCPTRSFTIVGDVAQTSSAAGTHSWLDRLGPVFEPNLTLSELTVNYRTPATITAVAEATATACGLPITETTAARHVPDALIRQGCQGVHWATVAAQRAISELADLAEGRVALIGSPDDVGALRAAVAAATTDGRLRSEPGGEPALVVTSVGPVKGLEFDVVVLARPQRVAAEPSGAADLYVAMTRPTKRLVLIEDAALPATVEAALVDAGLAPPER